MVGTIPRGTWTGAAALSLIWGDQLSTQKSYAYSLAQFIKVSLPLLNSWFIPQSDSINSTPSTPWHVLQR